MKRANYIGAPAFFRLNQACRAIVDAFGQHVYLVGSALRTREFRDVDVRCILPDEDFDSRFPGLAGSGAYCYNAFWNLLCVSISFWLAQQTDLNIDFQIQRQTEANAEYPGAAERHALGIFI